MVSLGFAAALLPLRARAGIRIRFMPIALPCIRRAPPMPAPRPAALARGLAARFDGSFTVSTHRPQFTFAFAAQAPKRNSSGTPSKSPRAKRKAEEDPVDAAADGEAEEAAEKPAAAAKGRRKSGEGSAKKRASAASKSKADEEEAEEEDEEEEPEEEEEKPAKGKRKSAAGAKKGAGKAKKKAGGEGDGGEGGAEDASVREQMAEEPAPYGPAGEGEVKVVSWNVNGIRAAMKKGHLEEYLERERPDVLCLQETKIGGEEKDVRAALERLGLPHQTWLCSADKKGYAGVAVLSREKPLSVKEGLGVEGHDGEGRVITAEFEKFVVVNAYVPNSGQKLERLDYRTDEWDTEFAAYLKGLAAGPKPLVATGDLNVAHLDIDCHEPKRNKNKTAGFTDRERARFGELLAAGLADTYRHLYPDKAHRYTYWGYRFNARARNKGWRLDYFLVPQAFLPSVRASFIRTSVQGSDHCPLGLLFAS
eukprot:tig00000241_g20979.t1